MQHELIVLPDAAAVSKAAAAYVAKAARAAVAERGVFSMAVSGGRSPWAMFADLAELEMPWESVELYQVRALVESGVIAWRPAAQPHASA